MSRLFLAEKFVFAVDAAPQADFTAAVTNIITSAAHGLSNGDCVHLTTTTTLPAGLSLATNYYVVGATTNTFKLSATPDGPEVDITDTGTGTHTFVLKGKVILVADVEHVTANLFTENSASLTLQVQGSDQEDVDFNAAQSPTNRWAYVQMIDLGSGAAINGDTGVVLSGTDVNKRYAVNSDGQRYLCAQITSYTAGNVNFTLQPSNS